MIFQFSLSSITTNQLLMIKFTKQISHFIISIMLLIYRILSYTICSFINLLILLIISSIAIHSICKCIRCIATIISIIYRLLVIIISTVTYVSFVDRDIYVVVYVSHFDLFFVCLLIII